MAKIVTKFWKVQTNPNTTKHNDHKFSKACTVIQCQAIGMMVHWNYAERFIASIVDTISSGLRLQLLQSWT